MWKSGARGSMAEPVQDTIFYRKIEAEEQGEPIDHIVLTGGEAYNLFHELRQEGAPLEAEAQVNGLRVHGVTVLLRV